MKIDDLKIKPTTVFESKKIDGNKKFNEKFNYIQKEKSLEDVKQSLEKVKNLGERLTLTESYLDIKRYKDAIKAYLESAVEYMYTLKDQKGFWDQQYFKTVEIVDEKLEHITRELMNEEKENLNIVTLVDEVQGLLIDLYR